MPASQRARRPASLSADSLKLDLPALVDEADELLAGPDPVDPVSAGPIDAVEGELDDAYEWSFANGARVMYAYSDISENEVDMQAVSWGGWSALEQGDRPLAQILAPRAVRNSGLGDVQKLATLLYDPGQRIEIVRVLP